MRAHVEHKLRHTRNHPAEREVKINGSSRVLSRPKKESRLGHRSTQHRNQEAPPLQLAESDGSRRGGVGVLSEGSEEGRQVGRCELGLGGEERRERLSFERQSRVFEAGTNEERFSSFRDSKELIEL